VLKALAKEPADRQQSAGDFAEELLSAAGKRIPARTIIDVGTPTADLAATAVFSAPAEAATLRDVTTKTALKQEALPDDPALAAERANPMIERAKEILGKDFLGVEAIRQVEEVLRGFGDNVEFSLDTLPDFPYTEKDLQIAKKNGEMLVLRPTTMMRDMRHTDITMNELVQMFYPGNLSVRIHPQQELDQTKLQTSWRLVKKQPVTGSPYGNSTVHKTIEGEYRAGLQRNGADHFETRNRTVAESVWDTLLAYYVNNEIPPQKEFIDFVTTKESNHDLRYKTPLEVEVGQAEGDNPEKKAIYTISNPRGTTDYEAQQLGGYYPTR
jgi:hypothetical protein